MSDPLELAQWLDACGENLDRMAATGVQMGGQNVKDGTDFHAAASALRAGAEREARLLDEVEARLSELPLWVTADLVDRWDCADVRRILREIRGEA